MKVILTQDVDKLGHSMDVVEVAGGYFRNYLMPRSLAMPATPSALSNLETLRRNEEKRQAKLRETAQATAAQLEGKTLLFEDAHVGSEGRLYGTITSAKIASALNVQFGVEIDRHIIQLDSPLRHEGFFTVPIRLHRDVTVQQRVKVGNPVEEAAPAEAVAA